MKTDSYPELEYIEHIKEAPMRLIAVALESSCPHWHEEYEVVFVLCGHLHFYEESRDYELSEGDVLLINPREVHSFRKSHENNICLILQFSPVIISEVYGRFFLFELSPLKPIDEALINLFRQQLAKMGLLLYHHPDGYQFALKSGLYAFISLMFEKLRYRPSEENSKIMASLADFDVIKQYIKEHFYMEELDQAKICRDIGMSRSKMYRVLRHAGAVSTTDLINYFRIEHAKHLLRNTNQSIRSIAADSGFPSDVSFFRVFKELTGSPPSEYRKAPCAATSSVGIQGYAAADIPVSVGLFKKYST